MLVPEAALEKGSGSGNPCRFTEQLVTRGECYCQIWL